MKARFHPKDCTGCAQREKCIRSCAGSSRTLSLPTRPQYEALLQARARFASDEGRTEYRQRAGVEGTLWQGVRRSDLRQARYRGLTKTHLQHVATAAALNIGRVIAHLEGKTLAQTRLSRFARAKNAVSATPAEAA